MERLLLCLMLAVAMAVRAQICPKRCVCQILSPNLATLCAKKGLLFVPPNIDRHTVELRLADNFVTSVKRKDFANMTRLVDLTLSRNTISYITPHAFADLENLRALHLNSNRLTRLGNDSFSGLSKLHHLILNNNQLLLIHGGAFSELLALEELDLSYNNLDAIPWDSIQRMTSLHTLSLDHNMLDFIPEGTFSLLQKLNRLDVTSNKLQKLPPDPLFQRAQVLAPAGALAPPPFALSFGGNPLHCNCELLWLRRLTREDDLETCASPPPLGGRYFWAVPEEEFLCEPPLITRHSHEMRVLEGQRVALRCKARGDPEPVIHWISPEGKLVSNSSRTLVYANGTLDILISTVQDTGSFTCISSNPAGEAHQTVALLIIKLPHISNHTGSMQEPDPGSSDISTSARGGANGSSAPNPNPLPGGGGERRVVTAEATSSTALIQFHFQRSIPGIRMFQIQYNGSQDDSLVYRMIPPSSKNFLVNNLAAGSRYDLCVLAIYDDALTALTATRVVGCVSFSTESEFLRCHFMQSQFLGGTMIIIIGGIIVASVLVFIIILMIRYKVCNHGDGAKGASLSMTTVHSQTNGQQGGAMTPGSSKPPPPPRPRPPGPAAPPPEEARGGGGGPGLGGPGLGVLHHHLRPQPENPPSPSPPSLENHNTNRNNSTSLGQATPPPLGHAHMGQSHLGHAHLGHAPFSRLTPPSLENHNTNRNNSTSLGQATPPPLGPAPSSLGPAPLGPAPSSRPPARYQTLPGVEARRGRARRRYSLCEGGPQTAPPPPRPGRVTRGTRSQSMSGIHREEAESERCESDWILESTV